MTARRGCVRWAMREPDARLAGERVIGGHDRDRALADELDPRDPGRGRRGAHQRGVEVTVEHGLELRLGLHARELELYAGVALAQRLLQPPHDRRASAGGRETRPVVCWVEDSSESRAQRPSGERPIGRCEPGARWRTRAWAQASSDEPTLWRTSRLPVPGAVGRWAASVVLQRSLHGDRSREIVIIIASNGSRSAGTRAAGYRYDDVERSARDRSPSRTVGGGAGPAGD